MGALFCAKCSRSMEYDVAAGRVSCPRCDVKTAGKAPAAKRREIPLTEAQAAIRAAHAPVRRARRMSGGKGVLREKEASESEIQTQIANRLTAEGWMVIRINSGAAKSQSGSYLRAYRIWGLPKEFEASGAPDIWALRGSRCLLIEVKDRKGYLRDSQCRFIEHAQRFRVRVHVCRSWEEAQALVDELNGGDKPTRAQWERLMALKSHLKWSWDELLDRAERVFRMATRSQYPDE